MILYLFSVLFIGSVLAEKNSFVAGVFEHRYAHDPSQSPIDVLRTNLNVFKKAAEIANKKEVDLLLFNEIGLTTYDLYGLGKDVLRRYAQPIPDPTKGKSNPCLDQENEIIQSLSCMAREHSMYVVANTLEVLPCVNAEGTCDKDVKECVVDKCPVDGEFVYNTDIVFDREGNLIAKYHKMHPYFESLNTPLKTEYVTFDTEFGLFGIFTCFDSVWENAIELVEWYNVEHVIFPLFWFEDEVTLSTVEWQQAWALTNRVNFIAANGHYSSSGTVGSGIYSKDLGALRYTFNPDGNSKLLVARVPRKVTPKTERPSNLTDVTIIDGDQIYEYKDNGDALPKYCLDIVEGPPKDIFRDFRCFRAKMTYATVKKLESPSGTVSVCQNGFCCSVSYEAESMDEDYFLGAFNGLYDVKGYFKWAEQSCLLVRCDPHDGKPCVAMPTVSKTVFREVEMKARFSTQYVYPAVSLTRHRLAPKSDWTVNTMGSETVLSVGKSREPLLRVSLMGRLYKEDPHYVPYFGY